MTGARQRLAGAGLLLLLATPAFADAESVVRRFYAAYAAGDANASAALWAGAEAKTFGSRSARTLRTRCLRMHELTIGKATIEGERAIVPARSLWSRWMNGAAKEYDEHDAVVTLQRENGEWRITSWRSTEELLAEEIARAKPQARRADLLHASPHLHTRRLADMLSRQAVHAVNRHDTLTASEIVALADEVAEELDDPAARSFVLGTESVITRAKSRSNGPIAVTLGQRAAEAAEQSGDPDVLARALQRLGRAQVATGDLGFATSFARVLALDDHLQDASTLALAASQLAWFQETTALREKLRYALLALKYAEESGDTVAIINAEMNLVGNHIARGDRELGIPHAQRGMELARANGMRAIEADLLEVLAFAELQLGRPKRFLELMNRALAIVKPEDFESRADILVGQAEYWIDANDHEAAERALDTADALLGQIERAPTLWYLHNAYATIRLRQKRYEEAIAHIDAMEANWPALSLKALVYRAQGRREDERCALQDAILQIEATRANIDHERPRTIFFRSAANVYVRLLESFMEEGDQLRALAVAERIKARTLHDVLARAWTSPAQTGDEAQRLNDRVVELNRRLLAIQRDAGDTTAVRAALRRARGDLDEALARAGQPPVIDPKVPPFDPAAIRIAQGMTVLEYVIGETKTTAFVIRDDGRSTKIETHTIAIGEKELRALVERFTRAVEGRNQRYRADARRLYDLLLQPLLGGHPSRASLCIIPDGVLWTLPFHVLIDPKGAHLIERVPVFFAPSLSILTAPQSRARRTPTVLALGNPALDGVTKSEVRSFYRDAPIGELPDAEHEVKALARLYGTRATVHTGAVATEAALKREAGNYSVLHVATHGLVDEKSPMYSALVLAGSDTEDGLLEAREILSLPMSAELVVLSACDTAGGRIDNGEGMIGLSWAFLGTGCPRTIATQWRVGSAAAADLMIAFHAQMATRTEVSGVASALRDAQLKMLRSRWYSHPYYWGGFILVGREP